MSRSTGRTWPCRKIQLVQTAETLTAEFGLPGILTFDEPHPGMPRLRIATPACTAELYLQGAHLTAWQPTGEQPVLFLSPRSEFLPGKPIRGGIPVVFPWFASPSTSPVPTPAGAGSHGFARTRPWILQFAGLAGDDLHLSLSLEQAEDMRALGFSGFGLACELILGRTLTVRLSVANTAFAAQPGSPQAKPFFFEEALHAYLAVGDSERVSVEGLQNTEYLDKTENFVRETQTSRELTFHGETDRPYLNTVAPLTLHDPILGRRLLLRKANSHTTVTWNPGPELAARLPDLGADNWRGFVCLETANAAENAVTLQPGEARTMEMHLSVEQDAAVL